MLARGSQLQREEDGRVIRVTPNVPLLSEATGRDGPSPSLERRAVVTFVRDPTRPGHWRKQSRHKEQPNRIRHRSQRSEKKAVNRACAAVSRETLRAAD